MTVRGLNTVISWRDFTERTSRPRDEDHAEAFTYAGSRLTYRIAQDHASNTLSLSHINVSVAMVRSKSWVLRDAKTDDLLAHEQLHYTLTAIGARDLHRHLEDITAATQRELNELVAQAQEEIQTLTDQANEEYDDDSERSQNATGQQLWAGAIRCALASPAGSLSDLISNTAGVCAAGP